MKRENKAYSAGIAGARGGRKSLIRQWIERVQQGGAVY